MSSSWNTPPAACRFEIHLVAARDARHPVMTASQLDAIRALVQIEADEVR
jgi:hypothetical protein